MRLALAGALLILLPLFPARAADIEAEAAMLRDKAIAGNTAWETVEELTTLIGPRLAGSPAEARARDWAVTRLKALGFSNVRVEPFDIPGWQRGSESAEIVSPAPQKLAVTALGNTSATPAGGIVADVVMFNGIDALKAAPDGSLKGKIAFVTHRMGRTQDGSSYGAFGPVRWYAPSIAAGKGAAATIIRSVGTDYHRNPHAGSTSWEEGQTPTPAGALSVPDSEQLERLLALGPVKLKLVLTPKRGGTLASGNVIAEIPGTDTAAGVVVAGGHLDSWDLGTGAIDDGAGVAITSAAAKLILDSGLKPRRTIRIVFWGSEEPAVYGGEAYAKAHAAERHALAGESDFGAGRIWALASRVAEGDKPAIAVMARLLAPLGVAPGGNDGHPGPDVGPLAKMGVPIISPRQDGRDYFDLHHTPDDTLDKIDPGALSQNVAVWATVLWIAANADTSFAPVPQKNGE
jgi:Zn-dependent M28 family amino/carboxypeptidase